MPGSILSPKTRVSFLEARVFATIATAKEVDAYYSKLLL
jgi:hypothetical protein